MHGSGEAHHQERQHAGKRRRFRESDVQRFEGFQHDLAHVSN